MTVDNYPQLLNSVTDQNHHLESMTKIYQTRSAMLDFEDIPDELLKSVDAQLVPS